VGDRVQVGPLGLEGVVQAMHDREAEIDVRGKRLRARVDDIRVLAAGTSNRPAARVHVSVDLQPRGSVASELNVIGCNVDEALARTERFLDEASMADVRALRVIHGYGTGQLRRAIAAYLQNHPLVSTIGTAAPEQGGGGVTIVELKE
jgi:DNA mismatch repair protein MutS2